MFTTMDPRELAALIASVLMSVLDMGAVPMGPLYNALMTRYDGFSWDDWERLTGVLRRRGLIETSNELVKLTPLGTEKARQLEALV